MFFDLKLGCTSLLGVVGKDNSLYWQSDTAGKMLGFKSHYFKYTFSTNTIKDIVPAKYKSSRKRYLNTKIVNHENVLAMLQKSKSRYYQLNYTLLKDHDFFVTVSLKKRYYPFVRMCSEKAVKATKFSDWLNAYKREINDLMPPLLMIPCASSILQQQQPTPASSSSKQCSTSSTQECSADITTTTAADTNAAAAAAAAVSPSYHYPEEDLPSTVALPQPTLSPSSNEFFQPNAAAAAASPRYTAASPRYSAVSPEYAPPSPRYTSPEYTPVSPEYPPPSPRYTFSHPPTTGSSPPQPLQSESLNYASAAAAAAASETMHSRNPTLIQPTAIKFMPPMNYINHYQQQQSATTLHQEMIQKPFSFWMNSIPPTEVYIFLGDKVTTFVPKC